MQFEIQDKTYDIPVSWNELTLGEFIKIDKWLDGRIPSKLMNLLAQEGESEEDYKERTAKIKLTNEDHLVFLDFYCQYISKLSGIPKDVLRDAKVQDVIDVYSECQTFMYFPNLKPVKSIEIDGVTYYPDTKTALWLGEEVHFNGMKFGTYRDIVSVQGTFDKMAQGSFDKMDLFTAILCRPKVKVNKWYQKKRYDIEPYDEEKSIERRELFRNVTMDKIWGVFFFTQKELETLLIDTVSSLNHPRLKGALKVNYSDVTHGS